MRVFRLHPARSPWGLLAQARQHQPSPGRSLGSRRLLAGRGGAPDGICGGPVPALRHRHRLALALGPRDHTLGCEGALPAADPVPRPEPRQGRIAGLGALRLQRLSPDRRPAGDDLLAAVPGARADRRLAEPVGGGCDRAGVRGARRAGAHALVSRSGLALGGRADRGAGLLLRGVDGLAHPAHRPGAEPRLSADRAALPRPRTGARVGCLRHRRRCRRGGHTIGARPGRPAVDLSAGRLRPLAHSRRGSPGRRIAPQPPADRGRCGVRAGADRRPPAADGDAGAGLQPVGDRLRRGGARLAASGPAAHPRHARRVRRLGPHGGLLGAAELRLAGHGAVHRAEHGRALHRRHSAGAAGGGCGAGAAVGEGDPVLHLRGSLHAALCARVVHAGVPRALHAAARRQPVPAAGRRDVPGRRPRRDPGGVCGAPAAADFLADRAGVRADAGAGGGDHAGRRRTAVDRLGPVDRPRAGSRHAADDGGAVLCGCRAGDRLGDGQR